MTIFSISLFGTGVYGQLTVSFREGDPITYTSYDDMEKDYASGKVRHQEGRGGGESVRRLISSQDVNVADTNIAGRCHVCVSPSFTM